MLGQDKVKSFSFAIGFALALSSTLARADQCDASGKETWVAPGYIRTSEDGTKHELVLTGTVCNTRDEGCLEAHAKGVDGKVVNNKAVNDKAVQTLVGGMSYPAGVKFGTGALIMSGNADGRTDRRAHSLYFES